MKKIDAQLEMIVWLKTYESPKMIIQEIYDKNCQCVWFDGPKHNIQNFTFEVLTNVPPPNTFFIGGIEDSVMKY